MWKPPRRLPEKLRNYPVIVILSCAAVQVTGFADVLKHTKTDFSIGNFY